MIRFGCGAARRDNPVIAGEPRVTAMLRRHGDVSLHSQDRVGDVDVGEGARFGECQGKGVVAAGVGRVERPGVEVGRAVVGYSVAGGAAEVPVGDRRQGLSGEERDSVDFLVSLAQTTVSPTRICRCRGKYLMTVAVRETILPHASEVVALSGAGPAATLTNQPELGMRSCPGPLKLGGAVRTVVLTASHLAWR